MLEGGSTPEVTFARVFTLGPRHHYVWTAREVILLRRQRIIGQLVGPQAKNEGPRDLTLPLQLCSEEVTLGLEQGFIRVYPDNTALGAAAFVEPDAADVAAFDRLQAEHLADYERKRDEMESKKRQLREAQKAQSADNTSTPAPTATSEPAKKKARTAIDTDKEPSNKPENAQRPFVAISVATAATPWKRKRQRDKTKEESEGEGEGIIKGGEEGEGISIQEWKANYYPKDNEKDLAHYAVFVDLWQKGHCITPGHKFGGDYLAYMGDPLCVHAAFVIKVMLWDTPFLPVDIITLGRLGVFVSKSAVFATPEQPRDNSNAPLQVKYITFDWLGVT